MAGQLVARRTPRSSRSRALAALGGAGAIVAALVAGSAAAQPPRGGTSTSLTLLPSSTTATSAAASTTTSTTAPAQIDGEGSTPAPAGAKQEGDGGELPAGIEVPLEAQRIIDSVQRTAPNSTNRLLAALAQLEAVGLTHEEAVHAGFGRFPVGGDAHYSHDWLYPRYGPGFRFHLGCDILAAHGTPVRAPVDGTARSATSELGGLSVYVTTDDGTFFYLAHLSGLVEGFTQNMPVATGDVVGYVGDSGNARGGAPHLHFGIHPRGGPPIDPKPVLDQFLAEAEARIPELVAYYESVAADGAATSGSAVDLEARIEAHRRLIASGRTSSDVRLGLPELSTALLLAASTDPASLAPRVGVAEARLAAAQIDWAARAEVHRARPRELVLVAKGVAALLP